MSFSKDISNLFKQFGGEPKQYKEFTQLQAGDESLERWPSLGAVKAEVADIDDRSVEQDVLVETAPVSAPVVASEPLPVVAAKPAFGSLKGLRAQLEQESCVAVGEIGLDYFIEDLDRERQQHYFEAQLELAREFDLPVIVHGRRAFDAVIATLRRFMPLHGVVHSFAGSEEQAEQLYKLGFMLGIGGPVTYERAQRLRRLVAAMPIEHLLLETDSPDQPDSQWRGQRNEPVRLPVVLEAIAELRGESPETIAQATTANAERLFGIVAG